MGSNTVRGRLGLLCLLAGAMLTVACTNDDTANAIVLSSGGTVELQAAAGQRQTIDFQTTASWTASCPAGWLSVSPKSGEAGSHTVTLSTTSINRTKANRSAQLTLTAGSYHKYVTVVQRGDYAIFDSTTYHIRPEGGVLTLGFVTNVENKDRLNVAYMNQDWIGWGNASRPTRTEWRGEVQGLVVKPNTSESVRTAPYALMLQDGAGKWMAMDTAWVYQYANYDDYQSADYTADGTVTVLQQASKGQGVTVILMGDGFADRDIANGTYAEVMNQTMENLFTEEPVRSLREYFTVYAVTAVSANSRVGSNYNTVFSCVPSVESTDIDCDEDVVSRYVEKVPGVNLTQTLAVVILNSHVHNGVTYLYNNAQGKPVQYAVALCPIIDHLESEAFRQVLTHEAIGHGLAKLGDEYGHADSGAAPDETRQELQELHNYGWMQNVDATADSAAVCWSRFIADSRFQPEAIGVYEGGYTYTSGIYRPTVESMMNSNESPFNAPSRKLIYDKIMLLGEGREASTLDEFAAFDAEHKPQQWDYSAATRGRQQVSRRPAPPVLRRLTRF